MRELAAAPMIQIGNVEFARYRRWHWFWPRRVTGAPPDYPYSWLMVFWPIEIRVRRL